MSFLQINFLNFKTHIRLEKMAQTLQSIPYTTPLLDKNAKKAFLIAPVSIKGSIALESSIAVPIFFFFFIQIISVIAFIGFQSQLESTLYQCGKEMVAYGYAYQKVNLPIPDGMVSVAYVQSKVNRELEKKGFEISMLSSKIMENEMVDLIANYTIKPIINFLPFIEIPAYARCRIRAWTGYDNSRGLAELGEKDSYVFVTETGSVYHESRNCKHLELSIKNIANSEVSEIRNGGGAKYYPCESCSIGVKESDVYITDYGTRYHCYLGCKKIKRTIHAILLSETMGKSACQSCGGK